ncbi:MAG: type II toxin-antitoxin system HicA family toxin [Bacteroidales bacterium]|nr:type II toxin-antitoxin system HicA family toxin [Bacteroidales bacterium]MBO7584108.1 type II toxin-antitoxin system HicA family toxin [Bacteroidales bacterium]MBP5317142.1 type II toxin-antitoxin system HicA family toxin [Bacteroidales bacterium]
MRYSELERKLKGIGCYYSGVCRNGHPRWYSPRTGQYFLMSHHSNEEVASGTLRKIKKVSGLT